MVLSLQELCLISIRDNIENGRIRRLNLPPKLRQPILDMILMHRSINNSSCLETLSSLEFLNGVTSLDLQKGEGSDHNYMDRVAQSLVLPSSDGDESIGDQISELYLNWYGREIDVEENRRPDETNFRSMIRLINRCRRLSILDLRLLHPNRRVCEEDDADDPLSLGIFGEPVPIGGFLNVDALHECLSIMENLKKLSITTYPCGLTGCHNSTPFAVNDISVIHFKNLSSLNFEGSEIQVKAWRQLLFNVRETLTYLRMAGVWMSEDFDDYLPFPLPRLKRLQLDRSCLDCSQFFIDNLRRCTELEELSIQLYSGDRGQHFWPRLNELNVNVKLDISMFIWMNGGSDLDSILDHLSRFKLVVLFKEKITRFALSNWEFWNLRLTTAFKHFLQLCPNLKEFNFGQQGAEASFHTREGVDEAKRAIYDLLFQNPKRASKLRKLNLHGDYEYQLLKSMAENCTNLDDLRIENCSQLVDDHFLQLVSNEIKPSTLILWRCENVSDNGLIPFLIHTSNHLTQFRINNSINCKITNNTWNALIEHCRYIERISGMPDELNDSLNSKCFRLLDLRYC